MVDRDAPWHRDHAFGAFCSGCHAGDPDASELVAAHRGLRAPLADERAACDGCHGDRAAALAARYRNEKSAAPTLGPRASSDDRGAPRAAGDPRRAAARWRDAALSSLILVIGALGVRYVRRNERRLRLASPARADGDATLLAALRRPLWSPYLAGAGLGVVVTIALSLTGHVLGPSGGVQSLAAVLGKRVAPGSVYFSHFVVAGLTFQAILLIGTFLGALVSAWSSGALHLRTMPDRQWADAFGPARWKRWLLAFLGAALIEFAAGIAGGCTGGLAISGGVPLAPAAFLFMIGMFAGGIPTAWIAYRGVRRTRS